MKRSDDAAADARANAPPNVPRNFAADALIGHAGDGNIHCNVIMPAHTEAARLNALVHDLVVAHGGSISAEHGIGQYRVGELDRCRSATELALVRRLKHALDPAGLLNPGKVLAPRRESESSP